MEGLKPCPFCGSNDVEVVHDLHVCAGEEYASVFCNGEGCGLYLLGFGWGTTPERAIESATKKWNRRAGCNDRECVGDASKRPRDAAGAQKTDNPQSECGDGVSDAYRAVYAVDGLPLEAGQTVWDENSYELVVLAIYGQDVHCRYAEFDDQICDNGTWDPSKLTHQRPVLDADGVPIREGDTVYNKVTGEPGTVIVVDNDGQQFATVKSHGRGNWCDPLCFTHTKPEIDSWERIEEDAKKDRCSYFGAKYQDCGRCTQLATSCSISKARDLVSRCRALAERERSE